MVSGLRHSLETLFKTEGFYMHIYVMCNILEGWYCTDMYRIIIQGCTDGMYLKCFRKRNYQMDIINNYWIYIVLTIITCAFG